ncbi:MAG: PAAR domain-containing protein [Pseudomonadota bacterium]
MKNVIRLGDSTSHGGKVISTHASHFTVDGVPVACVGDLCSCPLPGHNGCTIMSGSSQHTLNGIPIAFDGDATTCGAQLQSSRTNFRST